LRARFELEETIDLRENGEEAIFVQSKQYIAELKAILDNLSVIGRQEEPVELGLETGVRQIMSIFQDSAASGGKLIFIGNGGSAAIAGHMALDYWKNGGIPAICFNDGAQLTCLGNDYGYEAVFARPITFFARREDTLVAISSSGQSANILNGVAAAKTTGCRIVTLSGFSPLNPLRSKGDLNVYTSAKEYGFVELSHEVVLHMILDLLAADRKQNLLEVGRL
jgi:D-sedoheptulose 7-phosphate isomerase